MSETKHTPLPWEATQDVGGRWHVDSGYRGNGRDYIPVADLRNDGEGNAKLIATSANASPKVGQLLEAARNILDPNSAPITAAGRLQTAIREVEAALGGKAE